VDAMTGTTNQRMDAAVQDSAARVETTTSVEIRQLKAECKRLGERLASRDRDMKDLKDFVITRFKQQEAEQGARDEDLKAFTRDLVARSARATSKPPAQSPTTRTSRSPASNSDATPIPSRGGSPATWVPLSALPLSRAPSPSMEDRWANRQNPPPLSVARREVGQPSTEVKPPLPTPSPEPEGNNFAIPDSHNPENLNPNIASIPSSVQNALPAPQLYPREVRPALQAPPDQNFTPHSSEYINTLRTENFTPQIVAGVYDPRIAAILQKSVRQPKFTGKAADWDDFVREWTTWWKYLSGNTQAPSLQFGVRGGCALPWYC
jgi:hypothetical protein